ncbi:hypothetical protein HYH03_003014 [Edaphochlamys debaryana]|uniref:Uncharacterized protein n=1 Tax=Edaphochlamys debaryana TaxID=47281 RepID=A0A836C381_9CHLO|nr:hypothetical protein HYH03_003014 [Edaphochlamys debaryana]|eukprot:KAG2498821.1 hypothetical protein HYH03_003014 [Edaphochlamys debaryana]
MVWGQVGTRGLDDLASRLAANDPKLQSLTILKQRRFGHDDVALLVRSMASNTHLTELYASSHPLTPAAAGLLGDMLAAPACPLRHLCAGDSSLGDEGVAALARGVGATKSLTSLDLAAKGLGPRGAAALAAALATAEPLTHLVLSSNPNLGDAGLAALCGAASTAAADAAEAGSAAAGADEGAGAGSSAPAPAAPVWAGLRRLELAGCGVTAAGVRALASSANAARLEELRLEGNALGPQGGEALAALLQAATALRSLHLRGTELGDEGGEQLAAALAGARAPSGEDQAGPSGGGGGRSLTHLDLADCRLGSKTMAALCSALESGAGSLQALVLAGNGAVGDADAAGLGAALAARQGPALQELDLSGTTVGSATLEALSSAPGLRQLGLVGCPLGPAGAAALASSLRSEGRWADLEGLSVSGTGLGMAEAGALLAALQEGSAPRLTSLEMGANPATQDDAFPGLLEGLRAARPGLAVYWRAGDDPAPVSR